MIELRWLERKTDNTLRNEWGYYYEETVMVLQQRVRYHQERWVPDGGEPVKELTWTDWADIPVAQG